MSTEAFYQRCTAAKRQRVTTDLLGSWLRESCALNSHSIHTSLCLGTYKEKVIYMFLVSLFYSYIYMLCGARGGVVVEAMRYKPEGGEIDSRWCH
jgi:hypothetical protein